MLVNILFNILIDDVNDRNSRCAPVAEMHSNMNL